MKFTEHLAAHITPEWRKQYILYEEMKTMLYGAVERAPSSEVVEQSIITRYLASFDEEFFQYCDKELAKINTFYSAGRGDPQVQQPQVGAEQLCQQAGDAAAQSRYGWWPAGGVWHWGRGEGAAWADPQGF